MKTKIVIISILLQIIFSITIFAQDFLYVSVSNDSEMPKSDGSVAKTSSLAINNIFSQFGVTSYYQSFPGAKNPELASYYEIHLNGNVKALENQLKAQKHFKTIHYGYALKPACENPVSVNDDWIVNNKINNDALSLLNAACAWSVTKGSRNIIVGVIDTEFDTTHEDLVDTFESTVGSRVDSQYHGTAVSGSVAARTNNGKGIAGIGYNTRVRGYYVSGGTVWNGVWQAYQDGIRIINVSWSGVGSYPNLLAIREITENGTTIVASAGNNPKDSCHYQYADIPGFINVSGVTADNHVTPDHAHNRWVDVCALSKGIAVCRPNNVYNLSNGTSNATPQVAGVAALILSVNDKFSPSEIEYIIKNSADPIIDANQYVDAQGRSLTGSGKVNAYKAVLIGQRLE